MGRIRTHALRGTKGSSFRRIVEATPGFGPVPQMALGALFSSVAAHRGAAAALISPDATLSYAALDAASNRLARYLIARGVTAGAVVALALPRSPAMIVAMLAILKAGGAYLPLDPHHPPERLGFMIADSGARLIVTRAEIGERLTAGGQALPALLLPETDEAEIAALSADPLAPDAYEAQEAPGPQSLAYVMYTSGSTGTPKGAEVTHANIVNLAWQPSYISIGEDDTILQGSIVAFDAATFEIWGALLNGARLLLAPVGPVDIERLGELLAAHRATIALFTSGLFGEIALYHLPILAGLKQVLVGGDVMPRAAAATVCATYPALRLINGYGPTETTTFACTHDVRLEEVEQGAVPIGRPLRNVTLHILDDHGVPVAPGVEGELYIAGAGVSRGYRGRPELNAERFLPSPYGRPGALMYRTGDLARWREDGAVDFIGRRDGQVKLRGYRIELGEIEAALTKLPGIDQANVQARLVGVDTRLVAYLVARPGITPPDAAEMRAALSQSLPDYMIPQAYILLEKLPLTPAGKVDRRALPDPLAIPSRPDAPAPRNESEKLLCRLFAEVLGTGGAGIDDDFFLIGGYSLLALRLIAAISREAGKTLTLGAIFRLRTPAAIAAALDGALAHDGGPTHGQGWRDGRPALSTGQRRHWLLDRLPGLAAAYIIPFAFRLDGPLNDAALAQALGDVVLRHLPLRTAIVEQDGLPEGRPIERIDPSTVLRVHDLSAIPAPDRERALADAILAAGDSPFDLAREPMLRAHLLRLAPERHVLLLQLHHGAADGESMPPLFADLAFAYRARLTGAAPDFSAPGFDHADFAVWHEAWLEQSGEALRQAAYWRAQLGGLPGAATIAPDRAPDPASLRRAGTVSFDLTPEILAALSEEAGRYGTTPFALVLTAYAAMVGHLAGRCDVAIGVAMAGRQLPGLSDMVGCFVNMLPIRFDLAGNAAAAHIGATRLALEAALSHADLPFEQIVAASGVAREPGRNPIFEAALTWQGHDPASLLSLPGIAVTPETVTATRAKFDLALAVQPASDGGLVAQLDYDASRFSDGRAKQWADMLLQAIMGLAKGDQGALAALSVAGVAAPAREVAMHPSAEPQPADPAALVLVGGIFAEITGTAHPGLDEDFFLLGGNSLAANRVIARIRAQSGKRLSLEQFMQGPTIRGVAAALDAIDSQEVASHAVLLRSGQDRAFFCVHGIEGNLLALRHLAEAMGPARPLIGLRVLPADPVGQSVEAMAARYLEAVRAHQPSGPYLIGGYSFGGAIAFEMARQLRAAGETVDLLAILDTRWPGWRPGRRNALGIALFWLTNAPHVIRDELGQLSRARLAHKARNLGRALHRLLRGRRHTNLSDIVDLQQVPLAEQARQQGHIEALAAYRPAPCPMPIALFRARAAGALYAFGDSGLSWRATAQDSLAVHIIPGNHISMMQGGHVRHLAAALDRALDAAGTRGER